MSSHFVTPKTAHQIMNKMASSHLPRKSSRQIKALHEPNCPAIKRRKSIHGEQRSSITQLLHRDSITRNKYSSVMLPPVLRRGPTYGEKRASITDLSIIAPQRSSLVEKDYDMIKHQFKSLQHDHRECCLPRCPSAERLHYVETIDPEFDPSWAFKKDNNNTLKRIKSIHAEQQSSITQLERESSACIEKFTPTLLPPVPRQPTIRDLSQVTNKQTNSLEDAETILSEFKKLHRDNRDRVLPRSPTERIRCLESSSAF